MNDLVCFGLAVLGIIGIGVLLVLDRPEEKLRAPVKWCTRAISAAWDSLSGKDIRERMNQKRRKQ